MIVNIGAGKLAPQDSLKGVQVSQERKIEKQKDDSEKGQKESFSALLEQYLSTHEPEHKGVKPKNSGEDEKNLQKKQAAESNESAVQTSGRLLIKKGFLRSPRTRVIRFLNMKKGASRTEKQNIKREESSSADPATRRKRRGSAALKKRVYVLSRNPKADKKEKASSRALSSRHLNQTETQAAVQKKTTDQRKGAVAHETLREKRRIQERNLGRAVREKQSSGLLSESKTKENPIGQSSRGENTNMGTNIGEKNLALALSRYESNVQSKTTNEFQRSADEVFNQIVREFTLTVRNGGGEARLVVKPEFLGTLRLNVQLHQGEVNASVVVDNQIVKDLIMSRLNLLEDNLMHQGFSLGSFQVEVKERETGLNTAQHERTKGMGIPESEQEKPNQPMVFAELPWMSTLVNITV